MAGLMDILGGIGQSLGNLGSSIGQGLGAVGDYLKQVDWGTIVPTAALGYAYGIAPAGGAIRELQEEKRKKGLEDLANYLAMLQAGYRPTKLFTPSSISESTPTTQGGLISNLSSIPQSLGTIAQKTPEITLPTPIAGYQYWEAAPVPPGAMPYEVKSGGETYRSPVFSLGWTPEQVLQFAKKLNVPQGAYISEVTGGKSPSIRITKPQPKSTGGTGATKEESPTAKINRFLQNAPASLVRKVAKAREEGYTDEEIAKFLRL